MKWIEFRSGMRDGVPVGIGYFSVSFGFGALAITYGLQVLQATLISLTNLTSAGQFAGLTVMAASASMMDMVLTQLVINSRYALMSLALSQRMGQRIGVLPRLFIAIVVPPARKERPVLAVVILAMVLSCLFAWVPGLASVSPGISIVICTVVAAAVCAALFPIPEEEVAQ